MTAKTKVALHAEIAAQIIQNASGLITGAVLASVLGDIVDSYFNAIDTPQPGSFSLLNTLTAANSPTLDDTTSFTAAFENYMLVFEMLTPVNANVGLGAQVHSAGSWQTTGYLNAAGGVTTYVDLTQSLTLTNSIGGGYNGTVMLPGPGQTFANKIFSGKTGFNATSAIVATNVAGSWNGLTAIDGIRILASTANLQFGKVKIYGLK